MTIGDNLKRIREQHHMTQTEFGKIGGVSVQTISAYEAGTRVPRMGFFQKVSDYFGIPESELMSERQYTTKRAPVLGAIHAGQPKYAEQNIEGYVPITFTDNSSYFSLHVCGDSMNEAGMDDGDLIVVREQEEVEDGQVAVVCVNGDEATVKRFHQQGNLVILTPQSSNPDHQPQIYDLKKTPVFIQGLVVQIIKSVI